MYGTPQPSWTHRHPFWGIGLRISVVLLGLAWLGRQVVPASAVPVYSVYICKEAAPGSGVTGTFSYTVTQQVQGGPFVRTFQVAVGSCTHVLIGAPDQLVITETLQTGVVVKSITVPSGTITPSLSTGSVTVEADVDVLVPTNQTAVSGDPGTITFTNGTVGDRPATTSCNRTITGAIVANITVATGTTCLKGAVVKGAITVLPGAALSVIDTAIEGSITAFGASALTLCNSRISGNVSVGGATGFVLIGDGGDGSALGCAGTLFGGSVTLYGNKGGLEFGGNTVFVNVNVIVNVSSPPPPPSEDRAIELEGNTIKGNLLCFANTPVPINDNLPNVVQGSRSGQPACTALSF